MYGASLVPEGSRVAALRRLQSIQNVVGAVDALPPLYRPVVGRSVVVSYLDKVHEGAEIVQVVVGQVSK